MGAPHDSKAWATAQARAALAGITLHCLEGDNGHPIYLATRWAMTKQFDDLAQVNTWLQRVTGKKAEGSAD